jgi:hypothetical protein
MPIPRRTTLLVLAAALLGCSDDVTSPTDIDLAFIATRFDAFGEERRRGQDAEGAHAARATALALRLGIRPSRVSITLDGISSEWLALEQEYVFGGQYRAGPLPLDGVVMRRFVAWQGVGPDRVLSVILDGDTTSYGQFVALASQERPLSTSLLFFPTALLIERENGRHLAAGGGAHSTRESFGEACSTATHRVPFLPQVNPVSCYRAVFETRFAVTLIDVSSVERALRARVVQMDSHDVRGLQLGYPGIPTF